MVIEAAGCGRRTCTASGLALDVPRLPARSGTVPEVLYRGLVPDRRSRARDADGYYWFVGRADDVIKTAGHLVGPFEVESALMVHPAVGEAGVIGIPDPLVGERVKAFVIAPAAARRPRPCVTLCGPLPTLSGASYRAQGDCVSDGLPRTRSGKIMRRLLRARELGLPEGTPPC